MDIKASEEGLNSIKEKEGFDPNAYPDAKTGKYAVGFGMQTDDPNAMVTKSEADAQTRKYVSDSEKSLSSKITRSVTQAQADVLLDIDYNMTSKSRNEIYDFVNSGASDAEIQDKLLRYTKAKNVGSGQMEELPALVKRAEDRANKWGGGTIPQDDDIALAMQKVDSGSPQDGISKAMAQVDSFNQQEEDAPGRLADGLEVASVTATPEEVQRQLDIKKVSDLTGMAPEIAEAYLSEKSVDDVLIEAKRDLIANHHKPLAKWAAKSPENYDLMRKTGDYTRKVEVASRELVPDMSDAGKVFENQKIQLAKAWVYGQVSTGVMGIDEGVLQLGNLDKQVKPIIDPGLEAISEADGFLEILSAMANNMKSTGTFALQGIGSSLLPITAALGGLATAPVTGPAAPYIAATGAALSGGLLAFGGKMDELMADYKDPTTGSFNYDKALRDPKKFDQMRAESLIYATVMGGSDAILSLTGGYLLKHTIAKAAGKTVAGKIGAAVAGVAAEGIVNAAGEGGSELTATTAADLYAGRLTPAKMKANIKAAKLEAVGSVLPGASYGTMGYGLRTVVKGAPKVAALITKKQVVNANKANQDVFTAAQLRTQVATDPASKNNPQQVAELVNDSMSKPVKTLDPNAAVLSSVAGEVDTEIANQRARTSQGVATVSPSELDSFYRLKGLDPAVEMRKFSPAINQEYLNSKATDTSFAIPMGDWVLHAEENPDIDVIARFNGNEFNAIEANETNEQLEKDPYSLFEKDDIPEIPAEAKAPAGWGDIDGSVDYDVNSRIEDKDIEIIEPTEATSDLVSRPVYLTNKFRGAEDKKLFESITSRLKQANDKGFDPEVVEIFADMEMGHLRTRADVLGIDVSEVGKQLKIGKSTKKEAITAHGIFKHRRDVQGLPFTIVFAPTSNAKTIVHEFGHSWLHELSEDYRHIAVIKDEDLTDQQREYKAAMEIATEYFGQGKISNISELYQMPEAAITAAHESFAQTAEMYFLEGKFANSRIRSLLETFRKWFVQIASTLGKTYPQYPSVKISPEIERMFEGILGVSNKVEQEVMPMFPIPMFDPSMLGPEGAKYLNTMANARSEAIGKAYTKAFMRPLKERENLIRAEQNRIYDQATDEVDEMESMQMRSDLEAAYGEFKTDPEGETPDPRLSYESVLKHIAQGDEAKMDVLRKGLPNFIITGKKKGGMDVLTFMEIKGISDINAIGEMLVEMGLRDQFIDQTFNEMLKTEIPVMKSDEDIHEIAVDALNSAGREKLLREELKILATKYLPTLKGLIEKGINPAEYIGKASKEAIEMAGKDIVRNTIAYKFNADNFLRDSQRHGRQAARMFKMGDIEESFNAKYKEAIHYYAYKAAREAQKDIAEVTARIKQFKTYARSKDHLKIYDHDLMKFGSQLIQQVAQKGNLPQLTAEAFSDLSGISGETIERINLAVSDFAQVIGGKAGNDITVEGYAAFNDLLKYMMKEARATKKLEIDKKKVELGAVSLDFVTRLGNVGNVVDFTGSTPQSRRRVSLTPVQTLFEGLSASTMDFVNSPEGKLLNRVIDQEAEMSVHKNGVEEVIIKAVKSATKSDVNMQSILGPILSRTPLISLGKNLQPIIAKSLGVTFKSMNEVHALMLLLGSESGTEKALVGGFNGQTKLAGFNPETGLLDTSRVFGPDGLINELVNEGHLKKEHFDMYQVIWDEFEKLHPLVKQSMRESNGFEIGKIAGQTVKTPFGDYKGGYFPVAKSKALNDVAKFESLIDPESATQYRTEDLYPRQRTGMTNERTQAHYEVDLDMSKLPQYLGAVMNIIYLRNPLIDMGKVLSNPDVYNALEEKRPGAIKNVITPWFEDVSGQIYTKPSKLDQQSLARKFRQNANVAIYAFNAASSVKQLLGHLPALREVPLTDMLYASAKQTLNPTETRDFVRERSNVMSNRLGNSHAQMQRTVEYLDTNHDWLNTTKEISQKMAFIPMQVFQDYTDVNVWMGAYQKAIDSGQDESAASTYADVVVNKTNVSVGVTGIANFQRGEDIWKLFTGAFSSVLAVKNMISVETQRDQAIQNKAAYVSLVMVLALYMPTLIEAGMSEALRSKEDDKEKEKKEKIKAAKTLAVRAMLAPVEGAMPYGGRLLSSAILFGSANPSPALSVLSRKLPQATNAARNVKNGVPLNAKEYDALLTIATLFTGNIGFEALALGVSLNEKTKTSKVQNKETAIRRRKLAEVRRKK